MCPYCGNIETSVTDSRLADDGRSIRRRRECSKCGKRFTTYERTELERITVIKKDNTREPFDRNKIISGIMKACEKRPVTREQMDIMADRVERAIRFKGRRVISSREIGSLVTKELLKVDNIAYIRFSSVYKEVEKPSEFMEMIKKFSK